MRCSCCNKNLNDFESTLRGLNGNFLDTCRKCLQNLNIPTLGRPDLDPQAEAPEDWFDVGEVLPVVDVPFFEDD